MRWIAAFAGAAVATNIFSIDRVQSVEPYIAIDLTPGSEKRWTYRYAFTVSPK